MCVGVDIPTNNPRKRLALADYTPGAQATTIAPHAPPPPSGPGTQPTGGYPAPGSQQTTPNPVAPANVLPPDATSTDAVQARMRERQQIELLAGYRSTFVSGPRGPGGPSLAAQRGQLTAGEGLAYTPLPTFEPAAPLPPPTAGPPSTLPTVTKEPEYQPGYQRPPNAPPGTPPKAGPPLPRGGTPAPAPYTPTPTWDLGGMPSATPPNYVPRPEYAGPDWQFDSSTGQWVPGWQVTLKSAYSASPTVNTRDEYLVDQLTGLVKRNVNWRPTARAVAR